MFNFDSINFTAVVNQDQKNFRKSVQFLLPNSTSTQQFSGQHANLWSNEQSRSRTVLPPNSMRAA